MHVYLPEKYRSPFLHGVFLFSKVWVSDSKLWWLFRSCKSYLVILTSERDMTLAYFFAHKLLSEKFSTLSNTFYFLRKGIMEPTLYVLVDCPPVWSCLQVFNLGFPWGWGYVEEDLVIYKGLFSRRIFGISKLFWKIILLFVQNKLVLKNSSDSHR